MRDRVPAKLLTTPYDVSTLPALPAGATEPMATTRGVIVANYTAWRAQEMKAIADERQRLEGEQLRLTHLSNAVRLSRALEQSRADAAATAAAASATAAAASADYTDDDGFGYSYSGYDGFDQEETMLAESESEAEGTPMLADQPRAALATSPADAPSPIQPRAALAGYGGGGTPPNGIDAPSQREEHGAEAPAPSSDDDVAPAPRPAPRA